MMPQNVTTHVRLLLSEWKALAKLIVTHSTPTKDKPITNLEDLESFDIENLENLVLEAPNENPPILHEKQILVALQGPYGTLIRQKMAAFAYITRLRLELHLSKEEVFKSRRATLPEEDQISPEKIVELSFSTLDNYQKELESMTEQHNEQWLHFIGHWNNEFMGFLVKESIKLTERESKEFQDEETPSEILPRFIEVGLKLPKPEYAEMNFSEYLELKGRLIIQSSLSRQHLSHTDTDINKIIKKFDKSFANMQKQEKRLVQEQQNLTQSVLKMIIPS